MLFVRADIVKNAGGVLSKVSQETFMRMGEEGGVAGNGFNPHLFYRLSRNRF